MKLPIPDDWDGESYCCWAIDWPDSEKWRAILRGFITLPQRGWTWDERTGSILGVQITGREITARNLPERMCIVACNDPGLSEIATSMQSIANALTLLAQSQCCSDLQIDVSGGGQGTVTQPSGEIVPVYGSQPPMSMPIGEFPPNYPDEPAYLADKCRKAHMIIDGLIQSLTNIAAFGTVNAIVLAGLIVAAIGFGILFPPAMIPTAISVLLIISGSLFLVAQLNAKIIEDRDEWICVLYSSESTESIISTIADFLDIIVATLTPVGRVAYALKTLVLLLLNSDTLNQLFGESAAQGYPDVDCSNCQDCQPLAWEFLESGTEGWESAGDMPPCFGLADPPLAGIAVVDEKLLVTCVQSGNKYFGAIKIEGLEFDATPGWELLIRLERLGAESLYIDAVYLLSDGSCVWTTIDNNFTTGGFQDLTNSHSDADNKTIEAVYLYFESDPDAPSLQVNIEHVRLICP